MQTAPYNLQHSANNVAHTEDKLRRHKSGFGSLRLGYGHAQTLTTQIQGDSE